MEEYSKEFLDAYKERVRRVQNGEEFDYPSLFGFGVIASSAAFCGDLDSLSGIMYNGVKYIKVADVGDKNE